MSAALLPLPRPAALPRFPARRILSVWLPTFATDRLARRDGIGAARVTVRPENGGLRVAAANAAAAALGIGPAQPLADARALHPALRSDLADPEGEAADLAALADWAERYTPIVALDGPDGLLLDLTGSAHLFGGEAALAADLERRLRSLGLACRLALADTAAAAWGLARFAPPGGDAVVPAGATEAALRPLPVAALRPPPAGLAGLRRAGLSRIGDLTDRPRAPLAERFGEIVLRRLDMALGRLAEATAPHRPPPADRLRLAFPEPIARLEDVSAAAARLVHALMPRLERRRRGVRRLELALHTVDGRVVRRAIGTSRPVRDADALIRLLREPLAGLELTAAIETAVLAVLADAPLAPLQTRLPSAAGARDRSPEALGALIDRLVARLGAQAVHRQAPVASHVPERAARPVPPLPLSDRPLAAAWPTAASARPFRLLAAPEPIEATQPLPDEPPVLFRWRGIVHRVRRSEGPERIVPEWWRGDPPDEAATRDYYRVEDGDGGRFWLFRAGRPEAPAPGWYLHGVFA